MKVSLRRLLTDCQWEGHDGFASSEATRERSVGSGGCGSVSKGLPGVLRGAAVSGGAAGAANMGSVIGGLICRIEWLDHEFEAGKRSGSRSGS